PYHVELSQACLGLGGEFAIALRSRTDRMCGFAGDEVIVRGRGRPERCPVLSGPRLDGDQLQLPAALSGAGAREDSPIEVEVVELPDEGIDAEDADDPADAENAGDGANPNQPD